MAHIVEHAEFVQRRLQKLKAKAKRTPHQMASETKLKDDGFIYCRVTPAGSLLYKKTVDKSIHVALIAPNGAITSQVWSKDDV